MSVKPLITITWVYTATESRIIKMPSEGIEIFVGPDMPTVNWFIVCNSQSTVALMKKLFDVTRETTDHRGVGYKRPVLKVNAIPGTVRSADSSLFYKYLESQGFRTVRKNRAPWLG